MSDSSSGARISMPYRLVNGNRLTSPTCVSLGIPIDSAPSTNRGQNGCCLIAVSENEKPNITKPTFLGTQIFDNIDVEKLIEYIDWKPFFDATQIRGKYPNRGYRKLFYCKEVGAQAKIVFADAQKILSDIIARRIFSIRAVVGFYPCRASGDDILIFDPKDPSKQIETLFG
jgi:cobalamin-dependent methionine synthase I